MNTLDVAAVIELYDRWEQDALHDMSDVAASDDYYYAGAQSLKDFLLAALGETK